MTEVFRGISRRDDDDSPAKCRVVHKKGSVVESKRIRTEETSCSSGEDVTEGPAAEPVFGTMSVAGRSRHMEDAIAVRVGLCSPEMSQQPHRPAHFFAVYDGHGGSHVAALCREKMHAFLEEELVRVGVASESGAASASSSEKEDRWRRVMKRRFERMALSTCACGNAYRCGCLSMEVALGGSTAVVAVLLPDYCCCQLRRLTRRPLPTEGLSLSPQIIRRQVFKTSCNIRARGDVHKERRRR